MSVSSCVSVAVCFRERESNPSVDSCGLSVARLDRAKHRHIRMDLSLLSIVYVCVYVCGCACVCGERFDSSFGLMTF